MTTSFHYNDVPPQNWLDQLHHFGVPSLFDIQLNETQRKNLTQRAKNELKVWRDGLRDQIKAIEKRYSDKEDVKLQMLAPYRTIESLGKDLYEQVVELERRITAGRAIPAGFEFGDVIFGDMKTKRWHLGFREDEKRWKDFLATERRYLSMSVEYKNQAQSLKNATQRVKEYQAELQEMGENYKRQKNWVYIALKLAVVLLVAILGLVIGFVAFSTEEPLVSAMGNQVLGGIMLVVSLVATMIAILFARKRRAQVAALKEDIIRTRATLKELKQEALRQKQLFFPTQQTFKEVKEDYNILKASF